MKRQENNIISITLIFAVLFTVLGCNLSEMLNKQVSNSNVKTESPTPLPIPAKIQPFAPPEVGAYELKLGEYYGQAKNLYALDYVNKGNNSTVNFIVEEKSSEDAAKEWVVNVEADTKTQSRKLKQCTAKQMEEAENSTDSMPLRLIKKINHPNGGDVIVYLSGYNIFGNCYSTEQDSYDTRAKAIWAIGNYEFKLTETSKEEEQSKQMLEKFLTDYFNTVSKTAR